MSDAITMASALRSMGLWLSQQRNVLEQSTYDTVRGTQKHTMCQNIRQLHNLTPEQATEMTRAINEGPWTNEDKAEFATVISDVMAKAAVSGGLTRRANQNIKTFHKYLSRKDVEVLADSSKSFAEKMDQIVCRLVQIRLWLPSEQCIKQIMKACLVAGLKIDVSNHVAFIKGLKQSLKKKIAGQSKDIALPNPMPEDPRQLPQEIFREAYSDSDPPVDVSEGLCMTMDVALRSTNASSGSTSTALALPSSSSKKPAAVMTGALDLQSMMMGMYQMIQERMPNAGKDNRRPHGGLNNFQLLTPNSKKHPVSTPPSSSCKAAKFTEELQDEMPEDNFPEREEKPEAAKNPGISLFVGPPLEDAREAPQESQDMTAA